MVSRLEMELIFKFLFASVMASNIQVLKTTGYCPTLKLEYSILRVATESIADYGIFAQLSYNTNLHKHDDLLK